MVFNKKKNKADQDDFDLEIVDTDSKEFDIQDFEDDGKEDRKKKKKLPGWVIVPVIAVICVIAIAAAVLSGNKSSGPKSLNAVKAEKGDVKEVYTTTGIVESEVTKTFYSPVTAPVATCNAKVGAAVKAGDMLVTYDTSELEKNNTESQLQYQSALASNQSTVEQTNQAAQDAADAAAQAEEQQAAQINNLQQQVYNLQDQAAQLRAQAEEADAGNTDVSEQRRPIEENIGTLQQQLADMAVQYEQYKSEQDNFDEYNKEKTDKEKADRKEELARFIVEYPMQKQSLENSIVTKEAELASKGELVDSSALRAQADELDQQVEALEQQLDQAKASSVSQSSRSSGLTSGQKKSMQISENLAELAALSVEELVQKGRDGIKAEFDGVISDVQVADGTQAAQGGVLFTLASNQSVAVKLEVPSSDFEKVSVGNKATVKVGQNTYNGTITEVNKIAVENKKGNPVIGAKIHIDNPDDQIIIGVSGKATINVAEAKDVLCVSNEVVNTGTEGDFVYVIDNGVVKKKSVELGVASNNTVEVKAGLKAGDVVITDTSGDLKEGTKATANIAGGK